MAKNWFEKSYRRTETTWHISEQNPAYFSKFDPREYVDLLLLGKVETTCIFSNSHTGLSHWPTKVGHMHNCLKGRDILRDVIELCHNKGISVILYYSVTYNDWAYENHPDWRMIDMNNKGVKRFYGRAGVCCPNSPYRDFAAAQIRELCEMYDFEGIWCDMTFWTTVCYCQHCKERYDKSIGGEIPTRVDWSNPKWVAFQRKREEWLAEFAQLLTGTLNKHKAGASVNHQGAAFTEGRWVARGASVELARQSDFMNHDFYGNAVNQSFHCKLFSRMGNSSHFEYITCSYYWVNDYNKLAQFPMAPVAATHTEIKPLHLLLAQTYAAISKNGAIRFFNDAHPDGRLNRTFYERMGKAFEQTKEHEPYLGGTPCEDVGIYINFESGIDFDHNGRPAIEFPELENSWQSTTEASINAAKSLMNAHVTFGVITKASLANLNDFQILLLPNLLMVDDDEVKALKEFVVKGGVLYASKFTSLYDKQGAKKQNFQLAELFGVDFVGETDELFTYIVPGADFKKIFGDYSYDWPIAVNGTQLRVRPRNRVQVLATIALPYTDPKDTRNYSQILSNPPGMYTDEPAIVVNSVGMGKVIYAAGVLEGLPIDSQREVLLNILRELKLKPFKITSEAPKAIELSLFDQKEKNRYLINLLNFQEEMPNIPVEGVVVKLSLQGKVPLDLVEVPSMRKIDFRKKGPSISFTVPRIETYGAFLLNYKNVNQ
jgi:hypothetical protein